MVDSFKTDVYRFLGFIVIVFILSAHEEQVYVLQVPIPKVPTPYIPHSYMVLIGPFFGGTTWNVPALRREYIRSSSRRRD